MCFKIARIRLLVLLFTVLTVGGMVLFFNLYDPWTPTGPDLVIDGGFETISCTNQWTGWNSGQVRFDPEGGFDGTGGIVLFTTPTQHSRLTMLINGIEKVPALRISARASTSDIQPGPKSWHRPRADLLYLSNETGKPLYHLNHCLFSVEKDSEWKRYTSVFSTLPDIQTAQLRFLNYGQAGALRIDDVSVVPVIQKAEAPFFNVLFILLWIAAFAACLATLHPWKTPTGTGALLCALAITVGVILPGKPMDDAISSTYKSLREPRPATEKTIVEKSPPAPATSKKTEKPEPHDSNVIQNTHKFGHLGLFALLALFSMLRWAPAQKTAVRILSATSGLFLFAAATEALQFVTLDRKPGLSDLSIDLAGILLAVTVTTALTLPARLRKKAPSAHSG